MLQNSFNDCNILNLCADHVLAMFRTKFRTKVLINFSQFKLVRWKVKKYYPLSILNISVSKVLYVSRDRRYKMSRMLKYIFDDFGKLHLITRCALKQTRLTTNGIAIYPLSPHMERTLKNNAITGTDRRNACETVLRDTICTKQNKNAARYTRERLHFPARTRNW